MGTDDFWKEVKSRAQTNNADEILMYMRLMIEKANEKKIPVQKESFRRYGSQLNFFRGVESWFDRISTYGQQSGVKIDHYIISSGLKEMIEGTSIGSKFTEIYASSFFYDHNGTAIWPSLAINYTTKTQFLFRINKGSPDAYDNSKINKFIPNKERPVPFKRMIFIGDGSTDIPCFRLVKEQGGNSIAVYEKRPKTKETIARQLQKDGRVNFIAPADFSDARALDRIVKAIIDNCVQDEVLYKYGKVD